MPCQSLVFYLLANVRYPIRYAIRTFPSATQDPPSVYALRTSFTIYFTLALGLGHADYPVHAPMHIRGFSRVRFLWHANEQRQGASTGELSIQLQFYLIHSSISELLEEIALHSALVRADKTPMGENYPINRTITPCLFPQNISMNRKARRSRNAPTWS